MREQKKRDKKQLQQIYKKQKLNIKGPRIYQNSGDSELILGDLKMSLKN